MTRRPLRPLLLASLLRSLPSRARKTFRSENDRYLGEYALRASLPNYAQESTREPEALYRERWPFDAPLRLTIGMRMRPLLLVRVVDVETGVELGRDEVKGPIVIRERPDGAAAPGRTHEQCAGGPPVMLSCCPIGVEARASVERAPRAGAVSSRGSGMKLKPVLPPPCPPPRSRCLSTLCLSR